MKRNQLFKLLIDISFYLFVPVIVLFPGAIIYMLIFPDQEVINLTPKIIAGRDWITIVILLIIYAEYALFFVGFYNMRKFAMLLLKNRLFSRASVERTRRVGQFFAACGASCLILRIIYALAFSNEVHVEFGFSDTQLFLFLAIIGVFFLILSNAFARAMKLETENKLTV